MYQRLRTVKAKNLFRNLLCGLWCTLYGILRAADMRVGATVAAILLVVCGLIAIWTEVASGREAPDEMARSDEGIAARLAVSILLAAASFLCFASISLGIEVDVVSSCCMVVGVTLTAYGAAFAVLEREDTHVDYEDERV